jgi:hypothetical protein
MRQNAGPVVVGRRTRDEWEDHDPVGHCLVKFVIFNRLVDGIEVV